MKLILISIVAHREGGRAGGITHWLSSKSHFHSRCSKVIYNPLRPRAWRKISHWAKMLTCEFNCALWTNLKRALNIVYLSPSQFLTLSDYFSFFSLISHCLYHFFFSFFFLSFIISLYFPVSRPLSLFLAFLNFFFWLPHIISFFLTPPTFSLSLISLTPPVSLFISYFCFSFTLVLRLFHIISLTLFLSVRVWLLSMYLSLTKVYRKIFESFVFIINFNFHQNVWPN